MKMTELKELAQLLELETTGKEKKFDLIVLIEGKCNNQLGTLKVEELKAFANDFQIPLHDAKKKEEFIEVVALGQTDESIRVLFNISPQVKEEPKPAQEETLEEIGEELEDVSKDLEKVVEVLEAKPTTDMADIYEIDQKLSDVVKQDLDFSTVASLLDMGRIKFLDRKYVESMTMLMEASTVSQQFCDNYVDVTHAFVILSSEKILEECRQAKSNDEKAADALINAKRSFPSGSKLRKEAIQALYDIANKAYREEVIFLEERIAYIEPLISAMRVQGVDVFNAERYLHRAREAFLVGELANVNDYLDRAQGTAEESKDVWINEIYNDIPRVQSIITQAGDLGADTSTAFKHLEQAKVAFENEDYSLCSELKKLAERKAMESQHSQIQKAAQLEREKLGDADKILAAIYPVIREADAYGINTTEINATMSNARNALINNDYVNALTFAREAETQSKPIFTQVKAQREAILTSGQPLKPCQTCNSNGITVLQNGKAVCAHCGMVYDVQVRNAPQQSQEKKKKGWRPFG